MPRLAVIFDLGGVLFSYNPCPTVGAALCLPVGQNPFTPIDSNVRLVRQLSQAQDITGQRLAELYVLSNFSLHAYTRLRQQHQELFDFFDGVAVSGLTRHVKPDPRAYHWLLNEYGLRVNECIFIDDTADYVNTAQLIGMRGIIYSDSVNLEHELQALMVKPF